MRLRNISRRLQLFYKILIMLYYMLIWKVSECPPGWGSYKLHHTNIYMDPLSAINVWPTELDLFLCVCVPSSTAFSLSLSSYQILNCMPSNGQDVNSPLELLSQQLLNHKDRLLKMWVYGYDVLSLPIDNIM